MTTAKGMSSGYSPLGATIVNDQVFNTIMIEGTGEFVHGHTYGGNPLSAQVANCVMRIIEREGYVENSEVQGEYFLKKLRSIKSKHIKEVRGKGLLMGIELKPEAGGARRFCEALKGEGMLCKDTHKNVIRFTPPLNIKQKDLSWAFKRIKKVFKEMD